MGGIIGAITGSMGGNSANKAYQNAANESNSLDQNMYQNTLGYNSPYLSGGQGAENTLQYLLGTGNQGGTAQGTNTSAGASGSLLTPYTGQDLYSDPSYQFRLDQGEKALQRSGAAAGTLTSGAGQKAIQSYGQDYASQEYQNAFNRYNTSQNNIYSRLTGQAGMGMQAGQNDSAAGQNYANQYGQNVWGAANSQAGNSMNQAGAWSTGLGSIASAATGGWDPSGTGNNPIHWN